MGKINTGFNPLSDPNLSSKALDIYTSMVDNANFPTPSPAMPDVLAAINSYNESLAAAQTRDRTAVAIKNQNRAALIIILKALGRYVTFTSEGDIAMLTSSGFTLAKPREKRPDITKPENMQLTDGINNGELVSSVDGVKDVNSYIHQYKADVLTGENNWINIFSTSRLCTITGLANGQKYWARVGAIGANNQVAYSDAISRIVQ